MAKRCWIRSNCSSPVTRVYNTTTCRRTFQRSIVHVYVETCYEIYLNVDVTFRSQLHAHHFRCLPVRTWTSAYVYSVRSDVYVNWVYSFMPYNVYRGVSSPHFFWSSFRVPIFIARERRGRYEMENTDPIDSKLNIILYRNNSSSNSTCHIR